MNANFTVRTGIAGQHRFRALENPIRATPGVNLHTHSVGVEMDFVRAAGHLDNGGYVRIAIIITRLRIRARCEQQRQDGRQSKVEDRTSSSDLTTIHNWIFLISGDKRQADF
jgi:hypothetical protein